MTLPMSHGSCKHEGGGWHGPSFSFCDSCGFCGRCQGTGFSVISGRGCRFCKGAGNEQWDLSRTVVDGTSVMEMFGHETPQRVHRQGRRK